MSLVDLSWQSETYKLPYISKPCFDIAIIIYDITITSRDYEYIALHRVGGGVRT